MRTLYLSIIIVLVFSTLLYIKPIHADNENGVVIQNIQTLPTAIIIGHTFKINATLINNSTTPIFVERGSCGAPFSVTFDDHVVVRTNNVICTLQLIEQRLDPGTKITSTSPNLDLTYVAAENGTVKATVSFPYNVWNQTFQSNTQENISKPFSFMIYPKTRVPTLSIHDNQAIIDVALAIPDLQKWSNDWQYVSMGFMTAKNQPGNWQYATVNLKASSNSSLIPCDNSNDWWAWVMIDRTTMKVIQATYPTLESHNCNYATGGGPQSYGGFITKITTPLKQFKSGISAKDVKCTSGLQLVIKTKDGSPACVTSQTAQKLVERGWVTSTTDLKPWVKIDTSGLNATYVVNQPISFSVAVKGFGNYPCVSPQIKIHDNKNPNVPVFQDNGSTMSCPTLETPDNYSFDFPGNNSHYVIILNKTGDYTMTISYGDNSVQKYFSIVLPSNPQNITILENNAGIVLLNQPYYFETPNYTNDAYTHPVQVSFHDVLFTLFPPGFRGGLPAGGCMEKGPGLGQYYWTDAKFEDDTHELLHIFADSPSCTGSIPTMFSNHTNPQAGLTFYDGKMKLLVSTNVRDSTEKHNIAIQSLGQTPNVSNKTDNTKLRVYFSGGSGSVNVGSDKFNQTGFFFGNVGQVIKGLPVKVSISDPYDMFIRQYEISSNNISQDGSFNFTHTFLGKYDQDVYTLDFSYSNQRYELKYYPVVPP